VGIGTFTGGQTYVLGHGGGAKTVQLVGANMPAHNHSLVATTATASTSVPGGNMLANTNGNNSTLQPPYPDVKLYSILPSGVTAPNAVLDPAAIDNAGQGTAHNNLAPYTCVSYIIALEGLWPQPNQ
jgi:microcystin-dependent protein